MLTVLPLLWGGARSAVAGQWEINPSVGIIETYTDNVDLVDDNAERNWDLITSLAPTLTVRGSGGRASLDLDFRHEQLFFKNTTKRDSGIDDLTARGQAEVWDRIAFIDAAASMSRQVVSATEPTTDSAAGRTVNRADVASYDVSPFFLHHFGSLVETETRMRFSQVSVGSDSVGDSSTLGETFRASSGRRFTRLGWVLTLNNFKETRGKDTPARSNFNADADFTFALERRLALIGGAGYEDIKDGTLPEQPNGVTWRAGLSYAPSSRTGLRATYGRRFDQRNIAVSASHKLSARTEVRASYVEGLETSQGLISQSLGFITVDTEGNLIDERTGRSFDPGSAAFGLQTDTFRRRVFNANLSGTRRRNSFDLGVSWESRKTEATGSEQTVMGADGRFRRRLSRRTTAGVRGSFRTTDFNDATDRVDNLFTIGGDFRYRVFRSADAVLAYARTQRRSRGDGGSLTENAVTLSLRQEF